jgi:CNT family concentrative nucleoside transporter
MLIGFHEWGQILVHESLYVDGKAKLTFSVLFSWIFYPFGLLLGVSFKDSFLASALLSKKLFLNEIMAYADLRDYFNLLSERSTIILSYALCGFANFSSIGIQVGGISALEGSKRTELSQLGMKALLGGTIAAYLTGCLAGILI